MNDNKKVFHIALADDDEDDRELFEMALNELDPSFTLTQKKNGFELLSFLENGERPDVIFLDLNMPRMQGTECLKLIKENSVLNSLPVIILSTSSSEKDIEKCWQLGANYYIIKPFSYLELSTIIKKLLEDDWKERLAPPPRNRFVFRNNRFRM